MTSSKTLSSIQDYTHAPIGTVVLASQGDPITHIAPDVWIHSDNDTIFHCADMAGTAREVHSWPMSHRTVPPLTADEVKDAINNARAKGAIANFSQSNLDGIDFREGDLSGAEVTSATLREADLSNADLSKATLSHSDLRGADLSGASLRDANLSRTGTPVTFDDYVDAPVGTVLVSERGEYIRRGAVDSWTYEGGKCFIPHRELMDIPRVVYRWGMEQYVHPPLTREEVEQRIQEDHRNGERLDLNYLNLSNADLEDANLHGARMEGTNLQGACLRNAELSGASLRHSDLSFATFKNASLRGADLSHSFGGFFDMRGADLRGADLRDTMFSNLEWDGISVPFVLKDEMMLVPTCDGWVVRFQQWEGSVGTIRDFLSGGNPSMGGHQVAFLNHRNKLTAILDLFDAHVKENPRVINDLQERWGLLNYKR